MRRKIQLTVETHQLLVISRTKGSTQGWCSECAGDVPLIKPEEAAVLAGVSPRTIYRRVEAGFVHFAESPEGWLLICLSSLLESNQPRCALRTQHLLKG
jgi:hypothetical protein